MRKLVIAVAGIALVVVLYGAAGTWLAPRLVRDALIGAAVQQGLRLELAAVRSNPFTLVVALEGLELRGPQGGRLAAARAAGVDLSWSSLWRRAWLVERVRLEQPSLDVAALVAAAGEGAGALPPIDVGELVIEGGTVLAAQDLALHDLTLRVHELSSSDGALGRYEAAARLAGGAKGQVTSHGLVSLAPLALREIRLEGRIAPQGRLSARGDVELRPLRGALDLELEALPLAFAQRWLPQPVRIVSGALSGKGALRIGEATAAYQGAAAVRALRLEERDSGALLLAWQHAETDSLKLALAPVSVEIGDLVARAPEGRLVIAQDGSVNFAALVPNGHGKGAPARVGLERLRVEKGTLHFADRSLANPFEVTLRDLSGSITSLGNASSEAARIRLAGRVEPYGSARIRGTIDLDAPTQLADIRANLRNLQLEAFNPYIAKFAGYRIESGRLSADLRYELRERRLVGTNKLVLERIQLGEKLETRGLLDLPLELAVALLSDAQGRINLDIPVRGNLNDPQFDIGAITARAFGNVVRKIVAAPFRALAGLFGGADDDPGALAFDAGSAALTPPAEEEVAQLARLLEERPRLAIEVRAGYDAARDPQALRLRAARSDIARAAGVEGTLELSDPKVVRAAERLYLNRVGNRTELAALRKSEPRYGRALLEKLADTMPGDAATIESLAWARAEAVRSALIDHGVDAVRVRVAAPSEQQADARGVPTKLALVAA